ncbi:MAG TPA: AtpZ/AtpI family protein [Luteibaculaceae bacterium]|nr:AtpZ/AtpI family protein [Luteibaculaceae bacterium]
MPQPNKTPSPLKDYSKYAGMTIKMGLIIGLGVWGGMELDKAFTKGETPVYTLICSLVAVGLALYSVLRDFIKPHE